MFTKLLIANRGEIACRIARTARRLGIATVAVYSEADAGAAHVKACDEAVLIGPAAARESYLDAAKIISAAKQTGAEAVHPGYGFLSENAGFAEALADAGLIFVGPPASAIRAMGGKSEAKALMAKADVPLVPGYHGAEQEAGFLAKEAARIGWPLLIKASAGGGGKGMKVVRSADEFAATLESAKREAKAAFGDERVLLERYLERPRHVEIQVFADSHGHAVHLFERDCSIQRRHQKVVEEAPAPHFSAELRGQMGAAAVRAAQAIDYTGAGTIEFLLDDDGSFYFMEMNTRLQVEHPVTEAITGLDLVEWQLRVAAGERLPWRQDELTPHGHAIEVRLYAEDPARGFLPQTGTVSRFDVAAVEGGRVDAGIRAGDAVTPHYDPMIAKLIAWGPDRAAAAERLSQMLAGTRLEGLRGNLGFLRRVIDHPAFRAGQLDTGFIERHHDALLEPVVPDTLALAIASLAILRPAVAGTGATDLLAADGWLSGLRQSRELRFCSGPETEYAIEIIWPGSGQAGWQVNHGGESLEITAVAADEQGVSLTVNGHGFYAPCERAGERVSLRHPLSGDWIELLWLDPLAAAGKAEAAAGGLAAPMPGKVIALMVEAGQAVEAGAPLMVLEAMKMEHVIKAPKAGRIAVLPYAVGAQVSEGVALLEFEPEAE